MSAKKEAGKEETPGDPGAFHSLFEALPLPALLWREEEGVTRLEGANPRAREFTAGGIDGLLGKEVEVVLRRRRGLMQDLRSALAENRPRKRELSGPLFPGCGPRYLRVINVPVAPRTAVTLVCDLTGERRVQEELMQLQAELAHVCRLSTVGELAVGLAHELNQPLTAISVYARGSVEKIERGAEVHEILPALRRIEDETRRVAEIVRRLRNFVRRRPARRSTVEVNRLVKEILELARPDLERRGVAVELDLAPDLPRTAADSVQVQQVILNFVRNAAEALAEVPKSERNLTIRTRLLPAEEAGAGGGPAIEVSVEDRGRKLSGEDLAQAFTPFYTTKAEGLGLGLAISKALIDAHGGSVRAVPGKERGAVFSFTLPVRPAGENPFHGPLPEENRGRAAAAEEDRPLGGTRSEDHDPAADRAAGADGGRPSGGPAHKDTPRGGAADEE